MCRFVFASWVRKNPFVVNVEEQDIREHHRYEERVKSWKRREVVEKRESQVLAPEGDIPSQL